MLAPDELLELDEEELLELEEDEDDDLIATVETTPAGVIFRITSLPVSAT